jgi:dihydrofolate reductase
MGKVIADISVSLDGFVAGPDPTQEEPLGKGGEGLHEWIVATKGWREAHGYEGGTTGPDSDMADRARANVGAVVMGRGMFGPSEGGPWGDEPWEGWWGDDPPFHVPVYVLTHHEREPLEKVGGTTFHFVTDGIGSALEQARAAAGDAEVLVAGGGNVIQQCISAGAVDELQLHIVPVFLGGGARLLYDLPAGSFEPIEVIGSPAVTHVRYRLKPA